MNLLSPNKNGQLLYSGFLVIRNADTKNWNKMWCELEGNDCRIYNETNKKESVMNLNLYEAKIDDNPSVSSYKKFCFMVTTKAEQQLLASATSQMQKDAWIKVIKVSSATKVEPKAVLERRPSTDTRHKVIEFYWQEGDIRWKLAVVPEMTVEEVLKTIYIKFPKKGSKLRLSEVSLDTDYERILKASEILFDIVASWKDPSMIFVVREENSQLEVQKLENHHPQV